MIDSEQIKKDFPILNNGAHFLDSAASSLTPDSVIVAMDEYYRTYRANTHRGLYRAAVKATGAYEAARGKVAKFIGAGDPSEVIFSGGATDSANMIARMFEEKISPHDEIVTTLMEHHASLVPLQQLAKRTGATLKHIPLDGVRLDMKHAAALLTPKTRVVAVMLASNVIGTINDVAAIAPMAHKAGTIVVVDATAAVGHIPVDVVALGADALYFSGHKMLGPTGIGVLWVRRGLLEKLEPAVWGGGMIERVTPESATWTEIPDRFEAGTKNIAGAIGLAAAIDYLEKIGVANIHDHVAALAADAITRLKVIPSVRVFAEHDATRNVGNVSFVIDGVHPHDVAQVLADRGVAVRPGHHCAMPLHRSFGVPATTRASYYLYNTKEDTDALIGGVKEAQRIFTADCGPRTADS